MKKSTNWVLAVVLSVAMVFSTIELPGILKKEIIAATINDKSIEEFSDDIADLYDDFEVSDMVPDMTFTKDSEDTIIIDDTIMVPVDIITEKTDLTLSDLRDDIITQDDEVLIAVEDIADNTDYEISYSDTESITLSKPYQSKTLIVKSPVQIDTYDASTVISGYGNLYILKFDNEDETRYAYESLLKNRSIDFVEIDSVVSAETLEAEEIIADTNDSETPELSNGPSEGASADTTNEATKTEIPDGVTVAVIDSGIDYNNPLFKDKVVDLGLNLSTSGTPKDIMDDNGHGTAVASVIAKNSDAYIMPIKIANGDGKGTVLGLYLALQAAIGNNVDIINLSMTAPPSELLTSAIEEAEKAGITVVVSAGNQNANVKNYAPANIESVITVAALNKDYSPADYSNYGNMIDYAALGEMQVETLHGTRTMTGTSLSAAYVSAVIAYAMDNGEKFDNYVYPVDGGTDFYGDGIVSTEYVNVTAIHVKEKETSQKEQKKKETEEILENDFVTLEATDYEDYVQNFSNNRGVILLADQEPYSTVSVTAPSSTHAQWGDVYRYIFSNDSASDSYYVIYSNAVCYNGTYYDLVLYPFKGTDNARVHQKSGKGYMPGLAVSNNETNAARYSGYTLKVTNHLDGKTIGSAISLNLLFVLSDLDKDEFFILPDDFEEVTRGSNVDCNDIYEKPGALDNWGKKYIGRTTVATGNEGMFKTNCVIGNIPVTASGVTFYYGSNSGGFNAGISAADFLNESFKIVFDANGGTGTVPEPLFIWGNDSSVVMGPMSSNGSLSKSGYTIKGWSATQTYNSSNKKITASQTDNTWTYQKYCDETGGNSSNKTLTLYAQWEPNAPTTTTYTVSYNSNGGSGSMSSQSFDLPGGSVTIKANEFTRTGYSFAGWKTGASSGTSYSAGDSYSSAASITLYAQWTPNTYTVSYNANGGTGTMPSQSFTYGNSVTIAQNGFTRNGFSFAGNYLTAASSGTSYTPGQTYSSAANITLYAQWNRNNYTLTVNPNGGSWVDGGTTYTSNKDFTIAFEATKTIANPTREGYDFTGWMLNAGTGGSTFTASNKTFTMGYSNATLTAGWKIKAYTVTYDGNEQTSGNTASQTFEHFQSVDIRENGFLRTKYRFTGWNTAKAGTGKFYAPGDTYPTGTNDAYGNLTLYAQWEYALVDIDVTVVWDDKDNEHSSRPGKTTLLLINDKGEAEATHVLAGNNTSPASTNEWKYTFKDIPQYYDDGTEIVYTLVEGATRTDGTVDRDIVPSLNGALQYSITYSDCDDSLKDEYKLSYTITNTTEIKTPDIEGKHYGVTVYGTVTWKDDNDKYHFRPNYVDIDLLQNGGKSIVQQGKDGGEGLTFVILYSFLFPNDGTYKFTGLNFFDADMNEYTYGVEERAIDNYVITYDTKIVPEEHTDAYGNTVVTKNYVIDITNTFKPDDETERLGNKNGLTIQAAYLNKNGKEATEKDFSSLALDKDTQKIPVILKQLNLKWRPDNMVEGQYTETYSGYSGVEINLILTGDKVSTLGNIPYGKYEIEVQKGTDLTLKDIEELSSDNVKFSKEDGKYYVTYSYAYTSAKEELKANMVLDTFRGYTSKSFLSNIFKIKEESDEPEILEPPTLWPDYQG